MRSVHRVVTLGSMPRRWLIIVATKRDSYAMMVLVDRYGITRTGMLSFVRMAVRSCTLWKFHGEAY